MEHANGRYSVSYEIEKLNSNGSIFDTLDEVRAFLAERPDAIWRQVIDLQTGEEVQL